MYQLNMMLKSNLYHSITECMARRDKILPNLKSLIRGNNIAINENSLSKDIMNKKQNRHWLKISELYATVMI